MSYCNSLLVVFALFTVGCQLAPKSFPEDTSFKNAYYTPQNEGWTKLTCRVQTEGMSSPESSVYQGIMMRRYGRNMNSSEIAAIKKYHWTLVIDDKSKIRDESETAFSTSEVAKYFSDWQKDVTKDAVEQLSEYFFNNFRTWGEPSSKELVSGGFKYVYSWGGRDHWVELPTSLDSYDVTEYWASQGQTQSKTSVSMTSIDGLGIPASSTFQKGSTYGKYFFEFKKENGQIVPTKITAREGHYFGANITIDQCQYSK